VRESRSLRGERRSSRSKVLSGLRWGLSSFWKSPLSRRGALSSRSNVRSVLRGGLSLCSKPSRLGRSPDLLGRSSLRSNLAGLSRSWSRIRRSTADSSDLPPLFLSSFRLGAASSSSHLLRRAPIDDLLRDGRDLPPSLSSYREDTTSSSRKPVRVRSPDRGPANLSGPLPLPFSIAAVMDL
jgi:hypothetical protein